VGWSPTYVDEFKQAHKNGRVQPNKTIAYKVLSRPEVPQAWHVIYGILCPWGMFLVPILAVVFYFLGYINGWIVLGSFVVAGFLYKVMFFGACYGMLDAAQNDEDFYLKLVSSGAFVFTPARRV
jgi:hypothetical protein